MKIIISPSKTQDFSNKVNINSTSPIFIEKANKLVKEINKISVDELSNIMKIKGKLLQKTYDDYKNFESNNDNISIESYSGTVFKEIDLSSYDINDINFMNEKLIILSALYGVLKPSDKIKPYRLDMNMKIIKKSLYSYWSDDISNYFLEEDTIINLASDEYSKLINIPMINIKFKENKNDKYKTIGTYSKKARGMLVNYIIKNKIDNIEDIKSFDKEGYRYNNDLSDDYNIFFTRD